MEASAPYGVLSSATRRAVYDAIVTRPGRSMTEVASETGLYWGTVAFHVARLTKAGLVSTFRIGRRRLLVATQHVERAWPEERALLREPACRKVALAVVERPHMRILEICRATGLSERSVYHHVKRLLDAGLVVTGGARTYRGLEASAKMYAVLDTE